VTDVRDQAYALVDRYWEGLLELEPMLGTMVGDHRFDHLLADPGEAGRAQAESLHRGILRELEAFDRDGLDPDDRATLDVAAAIATTGIAGLEHRIDRLEVANQMGGPVTLLGELASLQQADSPEAVDRYEARLRALPAHLEAWREVAREASAAGVTLPRVIAERALSMVEKLLATPAEESPAVAPVGGDAAAAARITDVVRETVNPAYEAYGQALRDYLPHATETVALSALPGGEEMYAALVLAHTTLPLDPREVHQLGLDRWESIQAERYEVAGQLGFDSPQAAVDDRIARGESAPASVEAYVGMAEDQVRRSWDAAPGYFGSMPADNCVVTPVPAFMQDDAPLAYYYPPTEDGSRAGTYFINTGELPSRQLHQLASVTYHEANPGHHFQISIEQQASGRPNLRRFGGLMAGSAFAEGWGLYSERLADEMGLYLDGWERLGMLDAQIWRAGRLITDTGLHVLGWERQQAVDHLLQGGLPREEAIVEIDRYIAIPAQALSYMVGMIEIQRARDVATEREGADFSLSDFHDRVLALGSVPLPVLRRELGVPGA
jgi:uncharacterized protein (DUF885 family)